MLNGICFPFYHHYKPFVDFNECNANAFTCHDNAHCVNDVGSYGCQCNPGYTGDGKNCLGMYVK